MLLTCNSPNNSTDRIRVGRCKHTIRDRIRMSRIEGVSGGRDASVLTREAVLGGRPLFLKASALVLAASRDTSQLNSGSGVVSLATLRRYSATLCKGFRLPAVMDRGERQRDDERGRRYDGASCRRLRLGSQDKRHNKSGPD
jgi:hypothetical protein